MHRLILILLLFVSATVFAQTPASYGDESDSTRNSVNQSETDSDSDSDSNSDSNEEEDSEPAPPPKPVLPSFSAAHKKLYSYKLCQDDQYKCVKVARRNTWYTLFPDEKERDMVKRVNRTNLLLKVGQPLAIPRNLEQANLLDLAPFDRKIDTQGKKLIFVSLTKLAFGAYDNDGNLVYWGPVSGGRDVCPEGHNKSCNTISGIFNVFEKKGEKCKSGAFPVDRGGGAPMPYCMFFLTGFALHGSTEVPGYNASHGCVRMYKEDAKWLNKEFVELPHSETDFGTKVIVQTADNVDQGQFSSEN